jgi:hypothetical protein
MAQFTDFPEANKALGPPSDMTADTCGTLRIRTDGTTCVSRWQPSEAELAELNAGGSIWLGVRSGITQPAVFVTAFQPDLTTPYLVPSDVEHALRQFAKRLPLAACAGTEPTLGRNLLAQQPDLRQPDGSPMNADRPYFVMSEGSQLEHLLAMREAYVLGGPQRVAAYLKPYEAFLGTESEPSATTHTPPASRVDVNKAYPVSYTVNGKGERVAGEAMVLGRDLTAPQIDELVSKNLL